MSKGLLGLNVLLAIVSIFFAFQIWRGVAVRDRSAPPAARPGAEAPVKSQTAAPVETQVESHPLLASYSPIAAKSLFSPGRNEGVETAASAPPLPVGPKPLLYGVIVRDEASIAYLEDPASKRVAGYRVGDPIAGGTVQSIEADRVMFKRGDAAVALRLHDPAKPRPASVEPAHAAPGGTAPAGGAAGAVRSPFPLTVPGAAAPVAPARRLRTPPRIPTPDRDQ